MCLKFVFKWKFLDVPPKGQVPPIPPDANLADYQKEVIQLSLKRISTLM